MPLALSDRLIGGKPVEGRLQRSIPVSDFPRLVESLTDDAGNLAVDVSVSRSPTGVTLVDGTVSGRVRRDCQRCLEPVEVGLELGLRLAVTGADQEDAAPSDYEAWQSDEADVTLGGLLEDELILALPMVARHADETRCGRLAARLQRAEEDRRREDGPFAVLRKLKRG